MKNHGSVLVHVLITSVLVSVIAAGLLKMLMARHTIVTRAAESATNQKVSEKGFNRLMSHWNIFGNGVCADGVGYTCTGAAGTCGCRCTSGGNATVCTKVVGTVCQVDALSTPGDSCP